MKTIKEFMRSEGPKSFEQATLLAGYLSGVQFGHHLFDVHGVESEQAVIELVASGETVPSNLAAVESLMAGAILRVGVMTEYMYWLGACHALLMNGWEEFQAAQRAVDERALLAMFESVRAQAYASKDVN